MIKNQRKVGVLFLTVLFLLAPVIGTGRLFAQERKIQNRPYLDDRVWHYGFLVGFNIQDLSIANTGLPYINSSGRAEYWYADVPEYTPGFSVGILGELKANNWVSVRMIPTMHFGDKRVVFKEQRSGAFVEQYGQYTSSHNILPEIASFALIIMFYGHLVRNNKSDGRFMFMTIVLMLAVTLIGFKVPLASRLADYFIAFFILAITSAIDAFSDRESRIVMAGIAIAYAVLFFVAGVYINGSGEIFPYRTLFEMSAICKISP